MVKQKINKSVNIISLLVFIPVFISSFFLYTETRTPFLGLTRRTWGEIHVKTGMLILILVVIHLILHFGYIKNILGINKGFKK